MNTPLLIAEAIGKRFHLESGAHLTLFEALDLQIFPGETVAITGASGEGKSTLLQILGLLEEPSSGRIYFPRYSRKSSQQIRSEHLGFIFQQFHLIEDLTVLENVLLALQISFSSMNRQTMREQALSWVERVGLSSRADQPASRLSGGEKQRCAIARALVRQPELLLADEPTGSLDHENAQQLAQLLFELVESQRSALILVTHEQRLAQRAQRRLHLECGKLQPILES